LEGRARELPPSVSYRRHVEWLQAQSRGRTEKEFFQAALRGIEEPTTQFGLAGDHGVQQGFAEHVAELDPDLTRRVKDQSSRLGLSAARFFHAAWALVVARAAGREDVVFGTVLSTAQRGDDSQQMLGMRINTLPLRVRLHDLTATQLLRRVDEALRALVEHRNYPLVLAQRCTDLGPGVPLFTAIINYRHRAPDDLLERTKRRGVTMIAQRGAQPSYPMTISVDDRREHGFTLVSQAANPLDPKRVSACMVRALQALVAAIDSDSELPAVSLEVLPEPERRQVIDDFNATAADYPRHQPVHELFEQQVKQTPSAVALVWNERVMTYAELNGRANRLARALRAAGMQMGEYVPILMPQTPQLLIAQLAILKCGGVYVPMDLQLPEERREFIIKDCAARRVLARAAESVPRDVELHVVGDDGQGAASEQYPADLRLPISSASAAYVMYTSGSTGVPKGVVVPHSAITRLAINNGYLELTRDDCLVHYSNPSFDASTFEVWGALLNGARLVVVPAHFALDMPAFARLLREHRVTVLWMSVGLLNQYIDSVPSMFRALRCVITGGDIVGPTLVRRMLRESPPQMLLNAYGPTECTTFSTTFRIDSLDENAANTPIGRPIANAQIYILNEHLQPVPIGVTGELYIAGAGVATGYLNRQELTAQRFVADPYGGQGSRLYRTGDLGRWREDGAIEFMGRVDHQVKIRGFRVELGEIEVRLAQHGLVRDAVVVARSDLGIQKKLVAYVAANVALSEVPASAAADLREYLANTLPEYMVPGAVVFLEHLPLTSNGKIDRRALPAPTTMMAEHRDYTAPANATESMLARMWAELLQLDRVGREDNFFELGGHSLVATQVITRIRASFDVEVPIKALFDYPTLAQFSKQVDNTRRARLLGKVEAGDGNAVALLQEVASMSESEVRELLKELVAEEQS
jgi:amino acid adenylation domain-containing protein